MWGVKTALKTPVLSVMGLPERIDVGSKMGPPNARFLVVRWPQTPGILAQLPIFNTEFNHVNITYEYNNLLYSNVTYIVFIFTNRRVRYEDSYAQ